MGWKCDWQDVGAGNDLCESSLLFVRVVAYMIIVHENEPRLILIRDKNTDRVCIADLAMSVRGDIGVRGRQN